ncbi:hypothetical protein [Bacillus sp. FJAT-44742]|uniref:hypothetical protein n=1 Tax=Bacillus sp. FJAT-44742 TaxID=2014005 RepID=UPI000C24AC9E|nr:hypothetical protein [Bacillus sp. FJAT-44742]
MEQELVQRYPEVEKVLEKKGVTFQEYSEQLLKKSSIRSKKKRARQKALKKAFYEEFVSTDKSEQNVRTKEPLNVNGFPVTFLLKIGKEFFKEEDAVKFYYNAEKEQYYKNKNLLEAVITERSAELSEEEYRLFESRLEEQKSKKKK